MEVNVQIERGSKPLNQRDGPGVGRLAGKSSLFDRVRGNDTVDDAEHLAHDCRAAREQETQWIVFLSRGAWGKIKKLVPAGRE